MGTWGNELDDATFRQRARTRNEAESGAWARLWIAIGAALLLAVAFPFYAYEVQSRLLERDAKRLLLQAEAELRAVGEQFARDAASQQSQARQATFQQRLAAVRVVGISDAGGVPTVMAELQGLTARQAAGPLCAQAQRWLRRPVTGQALNIRAARGQRPAEEAGTLRCP